MLKAIILATVTLPGLVPAVLAQSLTQRITVAAAVQVGRDDERLRILNHELASEVSAAEIAKDAEQRARAVENVAALKREIELTMRRQAGASPPVAVSATTAERRQKPAIEVPPALSPEVFSRGRHGAMTSLVQPLEMKP